VASLDEINRAAKIEVLPDFRKRVTRRYDIVEPQATVKTTAQFSSKVRLPWGTPDTTFPECLLVAQDEMGQTDNPNKDPNNPPAFLIRVFEEIPKDDRVIVGLPAISKTQYGFTETVVDYVQLSSGATPYNDIVGVSTFSGGVLKTVSGDNNGTIRRYKLTYTTGGEMADEYELRFGGKLIVRTLRYLNQIPPTPANYTLFGPGVEYIGGLPLYSYKFASAAAALGLGGIIDKNVEYFYSPDQGTTGITRTTIKWASDLSVVSNPITGPAGSQLIAVDYADESGFRIWTATYASGVGVIKTEIEIRNGGKLILYALISLNAAPTAPSPTIGGTVVLISTDVANGTRLEDGNKIYTYRWAEGQGTISTEVVGEPDGALVYTAVELDVAAAIPASPGAGYYNIKKENHAESGYYLNTAVWKKPPADDTYNKQIEFERPGTASFTGSPPQLVYAPPRQLTLLAQVLVTYGTTQDVTVPFTVSAYASFYEDYTPETNPTGGPSSPITKTQGLGGYLAQASGISGTNSNYNGILCRTWAAALLSSIPSTFPSGSTVLRVDNDPYLTDVNGTKVYRRMKTTYAFP
jgi:hypothetical protein